ncbi:hypothetical protein [Kitasatospora azatica]|uniref:hypothetical protein n=1 Tax=Kitasatospora azatica TaxID=58347 RepID=UPI00055BF653|nr:hypothetical protein [Kitasatospora azatica]
MNATDDRPHTPTTSAFERRLAEELATLAAATSTRHDAFPARRRALISWDAAFRHRRLPLAVAGVAAATVAAVALPSMLSAQDGGSAAYAVNRSSDGTMLLELWQPGSLQLMVDQLRKEGVNAVGLQESQAEAQSCQSRIPAGPSATVTDHEPGDAPGAVRIDPAKIPPGSTLLLFSQTLYDNGKLLGAFFSTRVVETVPACFSLTDTGTVMGRQTDLPTAVPTTPTPVSSLAG